MSYDTFADDYEPPSFQERHCEAMMSLLYVKRFSFYVRQTMPEQVNVEVSKSFIIGWLKSNRYAWIELSSINATSMTARVLFCKDKELYFPELKEPADYLKVPSQFRNKRIQSIINRFDSDPLSDFSISNSNSEV